MKFVAMFESFLQAKNTIWNEKRLHEPKVDKIQFVFKMTIGVTTGKFAQPMNALIS